MTIIETPDSRGGVDGFEGSTGSLKYIVQLDPNETEEQLRTYFLENSPLTFNPYGGANDELYHRKTIGISPRMDGVMTFNVDIQYAQPKPATISFQTSGGSQKVKYSLQTIDRFDANGRVAPADPPDFKQGINVTKDSVEGVDIIIPQVVYKITRSWAVEDVTQDYLDDLERLTGTVNDGLLEVSINGIERSWKSGEVRFDGADVQAAADYRVEITYTLSINKNISPNDPTTHQTVAGITITDKYGWDYVWFYSEETEGHGIRVQTPKYAVIERVYKREDHDLLRLNG